METDYYRDTPESGALKSPHFDDETTILSARPVVPLAEVRKRVRLPKRVLPLVGAALLGGIFSAGILIYVMSQKNENPETTSSGNVQPVSPAVNPPETPTEASKSDLKSEKSPERQTKEPATAAVQKPKPEIHKATRSDPTDRNRVEDPGMNSDNDPDAVREARREARRLERRAERESQRRNRRAEDLFRIRDIFEGPGRPD